MSKRVSNKKSRPRKTPARSFPKKPRGMAQLRQARAALRLALQHYMGGAR